MVRVNKVSLATGHNLSQTDNLGTDRTYALKYSLEILAFESRCWAADFGIILSV